MSNVQSIKRIRFGRYAEGGFWYGFSSPILVSQKGSNSILIDRIGYLEQLGLTAHGRIVVEQLLNNRAIKTLKLEPFSVVITLHQIYAIEDIHDEVVELINKTLLDGAADVAEYSAAQMSRFPGEPERSEGPI